MGGGSFEEGISRTSFHPFLLSLSIRSLSQLIPQTPPRGELFSERFLFLTEKGVGKLVPSSPGYYSHTFAVWKALGSWRPRIDLSLLNKFVLQTKFKMEINQSVLIAVRRGDWMVSIDLKDTYLHVPVHPESRKFLRFEAFGKVYQFKVLCFFLSTAPQMFTRVMALASAMLHNLGARILRYLDDWLILASSRIEALWARGIVLDLCCQLGILVNCDKSHLTPSQSATYLRMVVES